MCRGQWDAVVDRVLNSTGLSEPEFYCRTRPSRRAALVRKTAVYLARVEMQIPREAVASFIGLRWRQVVRACREIEERRDDPAFDNGLDQLAAEIRALQRPPDILLAPRRRRRSPAAAVAFPAQHAA